MHPPAILPYAGVEIIRLPQAGCELGLGVTPNLAPGLFFYLRLVIDFVRSDRCFSLCDRFNNV